jgi:hypothetical protein
MRESFAYDNYELSLFVQIINTHLMYTCFPDPDGLMLLRRVISSLTTRREV